MERRTIQTHRPRLVRSADGKPSKIVGYAAVYYDSNDPGTEYQLARYGSYSLVERLMPGCFDRAVQEDDVRAYFNHNRDNILGRTASGTLRLSTDAKGLRYEIDPPDTQTARDLMESLQRGDVTGSSFSFDYLTTGNVDQRLPDGSEREIVEVREAKLYDVGPVTEPAYESTTAEARASAHKAGGSVPRWTPEAMRSRVERIDRELADLDRRIARNAPCVSRRTRRECIRERCNRVVAEIEHDAITQLEREIEDLRRTTEAALARHKRALPQSLFGVT